MATCTAQSKLFLVFGRLSTITPAFQELEDSDYSFEMTTRTVVSDCSARLIQSRSLSADLLLGLSAVIRATTPNDAARPDLLSSAPVTRHVPSGYILLVEPAIHGSPLLGKQMTHTSSPDASGLLMIPSTSITPGTVIPAACTWDLFILVI